jgi:hypothetical protein
MGDFMKRILPSFPVSQALLTMTAKTGYNHPEMNI